MKKEFKVNKKLPETTKVKGQEMQLLARSKNVAIYKKVKQTDSIEYAVGLIHRTTYDIPSNIPICYEELLPRDLNEKRTGWIHGDYNSAFNQFKKLVKEHG